MGRRCLTLVAVVGGLVLLAGPGAAGGNEPPNADAGLDQTVPNGTTVYLDAGGSVDPDGTVAAVDWAITAPNGTTVSSCTRCTRTDFTPHRIGRYLATATVTDDGGATRSDTLYVDVETPRGPAVTLTGPSEVTRGDPATFVVTATAADAALDQIRWFRNGSRQETRSLDGDDATVEFDHTFTDTGRYRFDAVVADAESYERDESHLVTVVAASDGTGSAGDSGVCENGGHPKRWGDRNQYVTCRNTSIRTNNGRLITLPATNPETVRYRDDGVLYLLDRERAEGLMSDNGWLTVDEMVSKGRRLTQNINHDSEEEVSSPEQRVPDYVGENQDSSQSEQSSESSSDTATGSTGDYTGGNCYGVCIYHG